MNAPERVAPYTRRVTELLGVKGKLARGGSEIAVHDAINAGLPRRALLRAREAAAAIPSALLLPALGISERTFMRIQAEPEKRLDVDQGGRLWRFAELFAKAEEVLGGTDLAVEWLLKPAMALENRRPIDLLKTAVGAQLVDGVVERMRYDVYQ
jgi:putative toxin-antitoxin system antitoxin component (TIGR02293 family)